MHPDNEKDWVAEASRPLMLNHHDQHIAHLREAARHHEHAAAHHAQAAHLHSELAGHHKMEHRKEQSRQETAERIAEVKRHAQL